MKKYISLLLALLLLLSMVGCGGGETTGSDPASTPGDVSSLSSDPAMTPDLSISDISDVMSGDENADNTASTTASKSSGGKTTSKNTKKTTATTKADIAIINKYDSDNLPKKDLNGFTLRVGAHYRRQLDPAYKEMKNYDTELRNDTLNTLKKRFNFKIEVEFIEANRSAETYAARIFSGDTTVPHILMDTTWASGSLIASGLFTDFNTVKYIDMSAPWWSQAIRDSSTIGGKTYLMQSEISNITLDNLWMLAYNKRIAKEIGLSEEAMYEMVKDKKWTLDKFVYYSSLAVKNLDSDSAMTAADRWGFTGPSHDTLFALMPSAGVNFIVNDNSTMRYGLNNANALSALTELKKVFTGYGIFDLSSASSDSKTVHASFVEGHALFYAYSVGWLVDAIREMDDDVGLIPLPLYGNQKDYRCRVDTNSSAIAIPKTTSATDLEKVGLLLEAISFACWKEVGTLVDYYSDSYLDDDSAEILKQAYSWAYVDPSHFTGTANFTSSCKAPVANAALDPASDLSGVLSSIAAPSQAAIDEFFEQ